MATVTNTTTTETIQKAKEQTPPKEEVCCAEFTPVRIDLFDEKTIVYKDKPFVKDRAWCFFYMPLNFGQAMTRACTKIEKAGAALPLEDFVMLSDMCSRWSTKILLSVSKDDVPDAEVVKVSGTFLTKVFEGPYSNFGTWIKEMKEYVLKEKGEGFKFENCEMYCNYATCPKCAKKYGKCYTVLFVKVD